MKPTRQIILTAFFLLTTALVFSQAAFIKGRVVDSSGAPLPGATIKLSWGKDSLQSFSAASGAFSMPVPAARSYKLEISTVGFKSFIKNYLQPDALPLPVEAGFIQLSPIASELDDVVVIANQPVKIMEDTVQYSVSAYKVREGAAAEDVIKKLPGITVDKDGNITSQGKPVARVRVNGKDFFGGDVQTATQNLPADILDNIQVIDDYGDEANVTGVKTGEPETIININIKKDKKRGVFGNLSAAAGTQDRYVIGGMMNLFRDETQLSALASLNNTNTRTFNFNGGGRGGGARGGNFGSADRGGSGNGLTTSQAAGLNYRDQWGSKISVYGSYSFSARNNHVISSTQSQDINPQNIRFTTSERESRSKSWNHRVTFNLEYKPDTTNYIKINPYVSFVQNDNLGSGISQISKTQYFTANQNSNASTSHAPNAGGSLFYNHRFSKRGRNLSLNGRIDYSDRSQARNTLNNYRNVDSAYLPPAISDTIQQQLSDILSRNTTTNFRVAYAEPLGNSTKHFVEASYEWNRSATASNRDIYDVDQLSGKPSFNDLQSNHFNYQFITNRIGLRLRGKTQKYNYTVGLLSQPSLLKGQSVGKDINTHYTNLNWIPSGRFVYNFGKSHSLTATYDGNSNEPNFTQLQPVADSSNLNNIVIGNPDLQAEFTNRFRVKYNRFDRATGRSIFSNFNYDRTSNKIVNSRVNNSTGTGRTTTYLNTDGFYRISGNGSFTQEFNNRKYAATIRLDASYDNNISYTDNQRNQGRNWNLRPGAMFRLDLEDIVDLRVDANYTFYKTITEYTDYTNTNKANTFSLGLSGKNYFFKDFTLGYDLQKNINSGFGSNVNSNPFIINLYAEYRFLKGKRATVRLQGFDLLNENTGISRTITETTITDSQSNRLARYGLLSFNIRLQKFGGGMNRRPGRRNEEDMDD